MIEGNLQDVSLPGLLQLLSGEYSRSFRLRIDRSGQHGDLFICEGDLLVATFGILEGVDALSEMLGWTDGQFVVERLPSHFKNTIRSNINLRLSEAGCFADQCAFLHETNVGLNAELIPSRTFGTKEWQEALNVQPLNKEDYAVLAWLTDGRTIRQAMREFRFDLKRSIGILYRLLITRSVEVVRATVLSEESTLKDDDDLARLANEHLAKHTADSVSGRITVEFGPQDIGGTRGKYGSSEPADRGTVPDTARSSVAAPSQALGLNGETRKDAGGQSDRETTLTGLEAAQLPAGGAVEESAQLSSIIDRAKVPAGDKDASKPSSSGTTSSDKLSGALEWSEEDAYNFRKRLKKPKIAESGRLKDQKGRDTQDIPAFIDEMPDGALNQALAEKNEGNPVVSQVSEPKKVLNVMASTTPVKSFDERRTDPLPLVAIDIERLLNSTFHITNIGTLALSNPNLDSLLQQILLDVERGKSLVLVLTDSNRSDAAVLATYKYCLDRGYIEHSDTVMALTVDLLLGRMQLEQYLLQRRRITGDQLRDLLAISQRQGIALEKLLVAAGFVLPPDMERLKLEMDRFAQH